MLQVGQGSGDGGSIAGYNLVKIVAKLGGIVLL